MAVQNFMAQLQNTPRFDVLGGAEERRLQILVSFLYSVPFCNFMEFGILKILSGA